MITDETPVFEHGLLIDVVGEDDGVRHAGVDEVHGPFGPVDGNDDPRVQPEWHGHLDGGAVVVNPGLDDTGHGAEPQGLSCDTLPVCKQGGAAGAVAAHLGLAAIGVEDAEAEVRERIRGEHDDPVGPYACLHGTEACSKGRPVHIQGSGNGVHHDEFVPGALHLGELHLHRSGFPGHVFPRP